MMRTFKLLIVAALLAGLSCAKMHKPGNSGSAASPANPASSAPQAAAAPAAPAADVPATRVLRGDGSVLFTLTEQSGVVSIDVNGKTYRGTPRDSGKRKYELVGGTGMFEVKPGDDGFKLRRGDGKLLWKVKFKDDKIKISDNDENQNPFELKSKESDRVKVVAPGEKDLGKVKYDAATQTLEVKDATDATQFKIAGAKALSPGAGVLLLDTVPELERYILFAELMSRGK